MSRLLAASALAAWGGATLLLSCLRPLRRASLLERLRPYAPAAEPAGAAGPLLGADSFREVVRPVAELLGDRLAHLAGVGEDLTVRLRRVHSPLDAAGFRLRQLGAGVAAFGAGGFAVLLAPVAPPVAVLLLLGAPLLAFLALEQRLATEATRWQERVLRELPVVSEQIGMLLASGWSLGTALQHVAERASGACSRDLARVCTRVQHGVSEEAALREWAATVQVPAVDRIVAVLSLSRQASDLGGLVAEEARATRHEVHRRLLESIERRSQQVWIPVTVATLVPGVLLLAVPFLQALRLFSAG